MKIKPLFCAVSAFLVLNWFCMLTIKAQSRCMENQIFTENKCKGDDGSNEEKQLLRLVNEYRSQIGLPPVPWSDALSKVANRHLMDLQNNVKGISRSWSNCPYGIKDRTILNCGITSPQRLSNYTGRGYDNVYRSLNKKATPILAINAWKTNPKQNALIINKTFFESDVFDACGIAIDGEYAVLWFGTHTGMHKNAASTVASKTNDKNPRLGLNLENAIANLNNIIVLPKIPSPFVNKKWTASSLNKSIMLEIHGSEANISEATIKIRAPLKRNRISLETQNVISIFLSNLIPNWKQRNHWSEDSLQNLLKNPKNKQRFTVDNKLIEMFSPKPNFISLTVKPYKRLLRF